MSFELSNSDLHWYSKIDADSFCLDEIQALIKLLKDYKFPVSRSNAHQKVAHRGDKNRSINVEYTADMFLC